jgi:late competence protein required for DNA uptake (superfamily II DNA/RNA helicase)
MYGEFEQRIFCTRCGWNCNSKDFWGLGAKKDYCPQCGRYEQANQWNLTGYYWAIQNVKWIDNPEYRNGGFWMEE